MKQMIRLILGLMVVMAFGIATAQDDQADRLQIVASYSILQDVVQNVAGDAADVSVVMPVGADPHTFEPTPRDLTAVADADVVFTNGALFEEGLLEAIENADTDISIIEVSACVNIIPFGAAGHAHDEGEDHDHEGEEMAMAEEGEDHDHEEGEDHDHEEGEDHDHEEGEDHDHEEGEDHDHEHEGEAVAMMTGDMSAIAAMCAEHQAQYDAIHDLRHDEEHESEGEEVARVEEDHDHEHSSSIALGPLYTLDCSAGHGHEHEHEDEDDHEEGEAHDEGEEHAHEHGEGSCDPHVWMEPHNVMRWTMVIRDTLIAIDPANAATYEVNAAAYLFELDNLMHDRVMPSVETIPEENRVLVTNHESMGYFAARFEFEVVTTLIPGGATGVEPSAADVAEVIDLINEEGVPVIFAETTVSDAVAEQIAAETGAEIVTLFSGSLSGEDGPAATYVDYISYNVTAIVEALDGEMVAE